MEFFFLVARLLFSALFLSSGLGHLTNTDAMTQYAAGKNIIMPKVSVIITGLMLVFGGLSILLGLWVDIGALLLIIFLLPAAFMMHNFWAIEEPETRQNEQIHFMKDLALAGGAFFIWYLYVTAEYVPWSIDGTF